jgi:hypothetical protein
LKATASPEAAENAVEVSTEPLVSPPKPKGLTPLTPSVVVT